MLPSIFKIICSEIESEDILKNIYVAIGVTLTLAVHIPIISVHLQLYFNQHCNRATFINLQMTW